jgi:ABC-type thiamin/hydroxymethylpyrimidine transport system permease subunit
MRFPFFAITVLLSIFCAMLLLKSFDYGQAWATALAVVGLLLFFVLSIISIFYEIRLGEEAKGDAHH